MKYAGLSLLFALFTVGCLNTVRYRSDAEMSAGALDPVTYRLILHGGTNANDLETVALLDPENDRWKLEPISPEFKYKVVTGVNAVPAVREGREFVSFHPEFQDTEVRSVRDERGAVFCYEIRPLYRPHALGQSDILDIVYVPDDKTSVMKVFIRVDPNVERRLEPSREPSGPR